MDVSDEVLAELHPSLARRIAGVGSLVALGALAGLLGVEALQRSPVVGLGFFGLAGAAAFMAQRLWRSTQTYIQLTHDGLHDSAGRVLARLDDIRSVERGPFAFKPPHGFAVKVSTPGPRTVVPGVWWRFGRRVGVGGTTPPSQARFMAEVLSTLIRP